MLDALLESKKSAFVEIKQELNQINYCAGPLQRQIKHYWKMILSIDCSFQSIHTNYFELGMCIIHIKAKQKETAWTRSLWYITWHWLLQLLNMTYRFWWISEIITLCHCISTIMLYFTTQVPYRERRSVCFIGNNF